MTTLLAYNWFWLLLLAAIVLIFAPPLYGIWFELRQMRKNHESANFWSTLHPSDDDDGPYDELEERIM